MDKNKKLVRILEGVLTIAVGVLIAIFGVQTVLDIYFGATFTVVGVFFFIFAIISLAKVGKVGFSELLLGSIFLGVGLCLLIPQYPLSMGILITLFVIVVIATGFALLLYGAYAMVKIHVGYGIVQMFLGAVAMTMGILYLTVPGFASAFWVVVGILIALYGILLFFVALFEKDTKSLTVIKKK